MTLREHVAACATNRAELGKFQAAIAASPEMKQQAQAAMNAIDESVIGRCWITKQRFDILTKALGA